MLVDLLDDCLGLDLPALLTPEGRHNLRTRRPAEPVRAQGWESWLEELFPNSFSASHADFHRRLWDHSEQITAEDREVAPYALIGFRGCGKTSAMQRIVGKTLAEGRRDFWVVACRDEDTAKDRVNSIREMLESDDFRRRYPLVGSPAVTGGGGVRAWSNQLLITASGQIIRAASMKSAARGMNQVIGGIPRRPDALWIDDPDDMFDTEAASFKNLEQIRRVLVPLQGRRRMTIFFTQTLTVAHGVAAQLVTNTAGFASDRILDGPINAIDGLEVEAITEEGRDIDGSTVPVTRHVIKAGVARWEGLPIEKCQALINAMGIEAFRAEYMNDFGQRVGALLTPADFVHLPADFDASGVWRRIVAVDPSGGAVEHGIVVVGASMVWIGGCLREIFYVLEDLTVPGSEDWTPVAILAAARHDCDVLYESNGVGAGAGTTLEYAAAHLRHTGELKGREPLFLPVPADDAKADRAMPPQRAYRERRVLHVGQHPRLEREWTTWVPPKRGERQAGNKSPNRLDAVVHGINWLASTRPGHVAEVGGL